MDLSKLIESVAEQTIAQDSITKEKIERLNIQGKPNLDQLGATARSFMNVNNDDILLGNASRKYSQWGSWIEGIPLTQSALINSGIIIDLIPCSSEDSFIDTYGCKPLQFLEIIKNLKNSNRKFFINIRDYNQEKTKETLEKYENQPKTIRNISIATIDSFKEHLYINNIRSKNLIKQYTKNQSMESIAEELHWGASQNQSGQFMLQLEQIFSRDNAENIASNHPGTLVRGGDGKPKVPAPIQIFIRFLYHLAFSNICEDIEKDEILFHYYSLIRRGVKLNASDIFKIAEAANQNHHIYTAPITGAYGGAYNCKIDELHPHELKQKNLPHQMLNSPILELIQKSVADKINVSQDEIGSTLISLKKNDRIMDERQFENYISAMSETNHIFELRRKFMDELQKKVSTGYSKEYDGCAKALSDAIKSVKKQEKLQKYMPIFVSGVGGAVGGIVGGAAAITVPDGSLQVLSASIFGLFSGASGAFAIEKSSSIVKDLVGSGAKKAIENRLDKGLSKTLSKLQSHQIVDLYKASITHRPR